MSNQIQKLDKLNHRVDFNEITRESQNNLKALEGKIRTKNLQSTYQMTSFKQDEVNQDIVLIYRDIIDSLKDVNRSISRKNISPQT